MNKIMKVLVLGGIIVGFCSIGLTWAKEEIPKNLPAKMITVEERPLVQMAILLDTSGSMSGLIDQARAELWAIVNEFIYAKRNGKEPELQVALYEYGKSSLPVKEGYIRLIVPFTTDLDKISEELFALKTNGGDEYCGWVIKEATQSLNWSNSPDDLKVVFIAGNEPFTQGTVDYRKACKAAVAKGIVVNTIHCGSTKVGIDGKWKDGAVLADGQYLNIDQSRKTIHVSAPQDKQIAELGIKLNDTYVAYGQKGNEYFERQKAQDSNAAIASKQAALGRAMTKSSLHYRNESWDLVDAVNTNKIKLDDIKEEDLPEKMKKMDKEERKNYIEGQAKQRVTIQQRIRELNEQRKKYVAEEMKKQQSQGDTLGSAVIKAIRDQAKEKNFSFESTEQPSKNPKTDASK
ncbi:MAG: VWA domain-containing protein [Planctomycetes bacterium]|nr:VWA domain-containing protein [Planctomycetota bacterium]